MKLMACFVFAYEFYQADNVWVDIQDPLNSDKNNNM